MFENARQRTAELRFQFDPSGVNLDHCVDWALRQAFPDSSLHWNNQGYTLEGREIPSPHTLPLLPLSGRTDLVKAAVNKINQGEVYADRVAAFSDSPELHQALTDSIVQSAKRRLHFDETANIDRGVATLIDAYRVCGQTEGHPLVVQDLSAIFKATLPGASFDGYRGQGLHRYGATEGSKQARAQLGDLFLHSDNADFRAAAEGYFTEFTDSNDVRLELLQALRVPLGPERITSSLSTSIDRTFAEVPRVAEALKQHMVQEPEEYSTRFYVQALGGISNYVNLPEIDRWNVGPWFTRIDKQGYREFYESEPLEFMNQCIGMCPVKEEVGRSADEQHGIKYLFEELAEADTMPIEIVTAAVNRLKEGLETQLDLQTDLAKAATYARVVMDLVKTVLPNTRNNMHMRFNAYPPGWKTWPATEMVIAKVQELVESQGLPVVLTSNNMTELVGLRDLHASMFVQTNRKVEALRIDQSLAAILAAQKPPQLHCESV